MINAFVGKPGMGKTYSMVCLAVASIEKGRDVYSNFFIDYPALIKYLETHKSFFCRLKERFKKTKKVYGRLFFWKAISELVSIKSGEILMDEAQIYINAREFRTLPPEFQYKAQQHRKHGVNFWLGVQNIKRIDLVARELVNSVFEMHRVSCIFIQHEYDIEDIDKAKRKSFGLKIFMLNRRIACLFDTLQEIKQSK